MSRPREPTLFLVELLEDTYTQGAGETVKIKSEDEQGNLYYYDGYHRWTILEKSEENITWKRLYFKPPASRRGVWIYPDEEMPKVYTDKDSMMPTSDAVVIKGKDKCMWLACWDGEVWHNVNTPDKIWMNKEYVVKWMKIPR